MYNEKNTLLNCNKDSMHLDILFIALAFHYIFKIAGTNPCFINNFLFNFQTFFLFYLAIHTHYYNSNLIWRTVSRRVDEAISSDHPRREASRVIQWYGLIHET